MENTHVHCPVYTLSNVPAFGNTRPTIDRKTGESCKNCRKWGRGERSSNLLNISDPYIDLVSYCTTESEVIKHVTFFQAFNNSFWSFIVIYSHSVNLTVSFTFKHFGCLIILSFRNMYVSGWIICFHLQVV